MKKIVLTLLVAVTLVITLNACSKDCTKCKIFGLTLGSVCQKDYATEADYQAASQKLKDMYPGNCK